MAFVIRASCSSSRSRASAEGGGGGFAATLCEQLLVLDSCELTLPLREQRVAVGEPLDERRRPCPDAAELLGQLLHVGSDQ